MMMRKKLEFWKLELDEEESVRKYMGQKSTCSRVMEARLFNAEDRKELFAGG